MRDIATATLSGNLTRDVELKQLPSGAEVARLRVASTARRRNGEEWVDKTNYFTVEVYGAQARACAQYLARGSRVVVEAELDWREWTDQHGAKREAVTFRARQVLFEGSPRAPPLTARQQAQRLADARPTGRGGRRHRARNRRCGQRRRPPVLRAPNDGRSTPARRCWPGPTRAADELPRAGARGARDATTRFRTSDEPTAEDYLGDAGAVVLGGDERSGPILAVVDEHARHGIAAYRTRDPRADRRRPARVRRQRGGRELRRLLGVPPAARQRRATRAAPPRRRGDRRLRLRPARGWRAHGRRGPRRGARRQDQTAGRVPERGARRGARRRLLSTAHARARRSRPSAPLTARHEMPARPSGPAARHNNQLTEENWMNDALRTAAAPAAVPDHEHGSTAQPWWLGATGRTLERERLEHAGEPDGCDRAAPPLLPALAQRARAADLAGARPPRSERADRSERSGRVAQPRRARPGDPPPPRRRRARARRD